MHIMDVKWFKKRQKEVGVTALDIAEEMGRDRTVVSRIYNERQRMSLEHAKAFAKVLDVSLSTIMEKAGLGRAVARQFDRVLTDGDASVVDHGGADVAAVARPLGGARPGSDVWRVNTGAMALSGFMPGDFMVLNTHAAEAVRAGDTVMAQVFDPKLGEPISILRRYEPPMLIADAPDPKNWRAYIVDNASVKVIGKVVSSWRTCA